MKAAPWSMSVKAASAFSAVLLVALGLGLPHALSDASHPPFADGMRALLRILPFAILGVAALFVVRGDEVAGRELVVQRLLWATRVPLDGIDRAYEDPQAMAGSVRVFGNGGLFAVTGLYRNAKLGMYRAYVTDRARAVVLRMGPKAIVVSPEQPAAFLSTVKARFPQVSHEAPR
jgi:hypothetical protein